MILGGDASSGDANGYHTDNDDTPTTILLCPATCECAEAETTSSLSIEILCEGS